MIVLIAWFAAAADPSLPHVADTLEPGRVVVRQPTGPSAVGLREGIEAWMTPVDVGIGGPRLGVRQQVLDRDAVTLSVAPSLGAKATLRRASLRVDTTLSVDTGDHTWSAELGVDTRWLLRREISEDGGVTPSFDRLQVPLTLVHDFRPGDSGLRTQVTLPLRDRGTTLRYGSGSVSWVGDLGKVWLQAGAGVLIGRPKDQYTLGTWRWFHVTPFPKLDVWVTL